LACLISGINLSYSNSAPVGTSDADILVPLSANHHPTNDYIRRLRLTLPKEFPGVSFAFLPADMVGHILNFGLPAPIDVQVVGNDLEGNQRFANALLFKMRDVSGTADLRIQAFDEPYLRYRVERTKAEQLGFSAHDIAQNLLVSLSGSFQTSPTFWVEPKESRQLSNRNANSAVSHRYVAGCREHSDHRHRPKRSTIDHGRSGIHATRRGDGSSVSLQRSAGD
jgi:hypothetical protein